jgi:hypothetical protein
MGVKCPLPVEREGDKFFPASTNDFLLEIRFEFFYEHRFLYEAPNNIISI